MFRVRRAILATLLAGCCLTSFGCFPKGTSSPTDSSGQPVPPARAAAVDIGPPPYPPAKMPVMPPPTVQPDPIVIPSAVVQYDLKVQIAAEVDGKIELIATPVTGPFDARDPLLVRHPRDENMVYRRLRENDIVTRGQTLVRLDEQLVASQIASSKRVIDVSTKAIEAGREAYNKYREQGKITESLFNEKRAVTLIELLQVQATVARLLESVLQTEQTKVKAEAELLQAETQLQRYFIRSPVNGRITRILKSPGEVTRGGETILEIQSTERVRIDGKLPSEYAGLVRGGMSAVVEPMVPLGPAPFVNLHRQEVTAVAVSGHAGRPLIVSAGLDSSALVWDVTRTKQSVQLHHPSGIGVRAVACTGPAAKSQFAATGADDGKIRLWDLSTTDKFWEAASPDRRPKQPTFIFDDGHSVPVTAVAFSPDGKLLATAAGRELYVWSVHEKKKLYDIPHEHRDTITCVWFTPQATLLTGSKDRSLRVWKLGVNGAEAADPVLDHRGGVLDVVGVSADGSRVLFDKDANRIDVIELTDARTVGSLVNHGANTRFYGLAIFSADDRFILTGGGDDGKGELQLWDVPKIGGRASERRRLLTPGRSAVTCAAFSADPAHPFVVVGTQSGGVYFWTPPPPTDLPRQLIGRVESVLPTDARTVQVRVVMENPSDAGVDALQERSTATIIIGPDGTLPEERQPIVAPGVGANGDAVRPAGGAPDGGQVVPAGAFEPVKAAFGGDLRPAPALSPLRNFPRVVAPIASPPASGAAHPVVGSAPIPSVPPVPDR